MFTKLIVLLLNVMCACVNLKVKGHELTGVEATRCVINRISNSLILMLKLLNSLDKNYMMLAKGSHHTVFIQLVQ